MKEKNFISAVVYVNNCAETIHDFLKNLEAVLEKNFNHFEIICVNDASTDNSVQVIKKLADHTSSNITLINMSFYQGKELAMNAGIDLAIGDFIYEFDIPYMDYNLDIILETYKQSLKGFDIVNVCPNKSKYLSSKLFYFIFNRFSNSQYKIKTDTFRILSRRAINRINSINKNVPFRKAIYANCGLKLSNINYNQTNSAKGHSNKSDRKKTASEALVLFTDIGYKFSFFLALIMMLTTVAVGVYTIVIFASSTPIDGWTTTMLFLSFGFFGIFALFAIVLKYLSIIINLIFKNKQYLIESIDKLN